MIETVDTHVLLTELLARFDHAVFAGMKVHESSNEYYELKDKKGNVRTCQGLCFGIMEMTEIHHREDQHEAEGDW